MNHPNSSTKPRARATRTRNCRECNEPITLRSKSHLCRSCSQRPYTVTSDPTPEQIAAATSAIRATWSEREHRVRAGMIPDQRVEVAQAKTPTIPRE